MHREPRRAAELAEAEQQLYVAQSKTFHQPTVQNTWQARGLAVTPSNTESAARVRTATFQYSLASMMVSTR